MTVLKIGVAVTLAVFTTSCADRERRNAEIQASTAATLENFRLENNGLIENVSSCITREAQTTSLNRVDTETAAHAVIGRCAGPLQEHKTLMSRNFPGNPVQFEAWWRTKEVGDMDFARKAIAIVRTGG